MPITMFYAGALGIVLLVLSIRVIQGRGKTKVNLGDGGNEKMIRLMRGQANFVEYVPIILVLLGLLETQGVAPLVLHGLGASLLIGRLLHGYAFAFSEYFPVGRFGGTLLTQLVLGLSAALCLWNGIQAL